MLLGFCQPLWAHSCEVKGAKESLCVCRTQAPHGEIEADHLAKFAAYRRTSASGSATLVLRAHWLGQWIGQATAAASKCPLPRVSPRPCI